MCPYLAIVCLGDMPKHVLRLIEILTVYLCCLNPTIVWKNLKL